MISMELEDGALLGIGAAVQLVHQSSRTAFPGPLGLRPECEHTPEWVVFEPAGPHGTNSATQLTAQCILSLISRSNVVLGSRHRIPDRPSAAHLRRLGWMESPSARFGQQR